MNNRDQRRVLGILAPTARKYLCEAPSVKRALLEEGAFDADGPSLGALVFVKKRPS